MGFPPSTLGGVQPANGKLNAKWNLKVPQLQFVDMGGLNAAIDTGNDNCIYDPNCYGGAIGGHYRDSSPGLVPTTALIGSPTTTLSTRQTTGLQVGEVAEMYLYKYVGSSSLGDQYAIPFSIKPGQKYKVNQISFDYSTSVNYTDGMARIYIYDDTNAVYLGELSQRDLVANENGTYSCTFQATDASDYALVFHYVDTGSVTWEIRVGNFYVGMKPLVKGPVITDWISWTPTGPWTTGTWVGKKRRVGDMGEYEVKFTVSTAPSGNFTINLPSGEVVDTSKISDINQQTFGLGTIFDTSANTYYACIAGYNSTTNVYLQVCNSAGTYLQEATNISPTVPVTFAVGDIVTARFSVPIVGWSSNVALSEDTGNRVVAFSVRPGAQQTGVNPNGTAVKLTQYSVKNYDTTGSFDTTNNYFVAPESGVYSFNAICRILSTNVLNNLYMAQFIKNSTTVFGRGTAVYPTAASEFYINANGQVNLDKGDFVEFQMTGNGNNSVSTLSTSSTGLSSLTWMGHKIQTPQSLGQSEVVNCKYTCATGLNLSSSGTTYFLDFATKSYDTHDAVLGEGSGIVSTTNTGWRFVCPQAGVYSVSSAIRFVSSAAWASGEGARLDVYKNGSVESEIDYKDSLITTGSPSMVLTGTTDVKCNKGDYLEIGATQSSGGALALNGIGTLNYVAIKKVG